MSFPIPDRAPPQFRITIEYTDNSGRDGSSMRQETYVLGAPVVHSNGVLLFESADLAARKFWEGAVLMGLFDPP